MKQIYSAVAVFVAAGILLQAQTSNAHMADFDGDGRKDIAVFRPSNGTWYIQGSSLGFWDYQYGLSGDVPVPGDYNGYGRASAAVFRPSSSTWFIAPVGPAPYQVQFGLHGDVPVPGDYDGDGKTDVAVFRPSNGTWYIQGSRFGYWSYQWGLPGDIPVPGDYDGDGRVDAAVFRPSNNTWLVSTTSSGTFSLAFRLPGDIPVAADFDGDSKTDVAVFRPSNGTWYIQGTRLGYWSYQWGLPGDVPVPGDYDGDGRVDAAVFRPSENTWYVSATSSGTSILQFGLAGDVPLVSNYLNFLNSASPSLSLTNLTHPDLAPDFAVGDTYQITLIGAPNQAVTMVQTANGGTSHQSFGSTDAYGRKVIACVEQTSEIGSYTQVWSVGNVQVTPAVSFMIGQLGGGGTVSTSDLGETSDGHVAGVSTLSVANGSVTTYSATELDYTASLYYDAGTVGTLYEEGNVIRSGSASGSGLADGYMSAPVSAWNDYDLQTDHYVVAYIPYGVYFENPFYYQDGSCGDVTSDCTFGPGGGVYYIAAASIYLGSTLAHQTNVPQDGSTALVSDIAVGDYFSSATQSQPLPSGAQHGLSMWIQMIKKVAPILFIARSVWADQNPNNPYIYPLPYLVDLFDDTQTSPGPGNDAERERTYLLEDTYGRAWSNSNPVNVSEKFLYVGGAQNVMPTPNNPSTQGTPWSPSTKEMADGKFTDAYGFRAAAQPPVWFLQFYWAWGFPVSSGFSLPTIPGVNDGSLPGMSGLAVPLMIKSKNPATAFQNCAMFGAQGVLFTTQYIGINGEASPATPPGCPADLGSF